MTDEMKHHRSRVLDAEKAGDQAGLKVAMGEFYAAAQRREALRKRRETIIKELTRPRALTDAETLELTREMRRIQSELDGIAREGAA